MKISFLNSSKKGSALIVGMLITIIIIVIAVYLLEKIIPSSQNIKGMENGNISYYRANSALNEALLSMSGSDPNVNISSGVLLNGSGILYKITSSGTLLPKSGLGNSEYDTDWSIIAPGKPVQLILNSTSAIDWSYGHFYFRVPDLNQNGSWTDQTLSGGTLPIINWTLSTSNDALLANGSQIMANMIDGGAPTIGTYVGLTLSGSIMTFNDFYTANCIPPKMCTLKFSLINPLVLNDNITISPYLEYQGSFGQTIPLQTAVLEAQGFAGGFRKNITRFVQQMTTNEALDFTVFQ